MLRPDAWLLSHLDFYSLLRPLFFGLDPEKAHTLALKLLKKGLGPKVKSDGDPILHTSVCGLEFCNPLGLAAGFDKNAEVFPEALDFGFGFVEIGTITPLPQRGNPKPRLFRAIGAEAAINRLGFDSDGMEACLWRMKAWHDTTRRPITNDYKDKNKRRLIGVNIGKNKDSQNAADDYVAGFKLLAPYADYITINISSPNTPGLRHLQNRAELAPLLRQINETREAGTHKPPLFVKIAPDLTGAQQEDIAEVVLSAGVQGLIIGNTTVTRGRSLPQKFAREEGGLSGRPLFELSTQMLARLYKLTQGKMPLIGCGGISSGADAYAKICAGASLVQLYTALIFKGPHLVPRLARELAALLKRDGFKSVSAAVGTKNLG